MVKYRRMEHRDTQRSAAFWDREISAPTHSSWMEHPLVREYVNTRIGGSSNLWPLDWFQLQVEQHFRHGLSIGCGTGVLERDLIRRGVCDDIDAYDASSESIATATAEAMREGFRDRIRYYVADFNRPRRLRHRYDAVFFHQSLHHVWKLEKLFHDTLRALPSSGLLYLDEYVGPSRSEWRDSMLTTQQAIFRLVPPTARRTDALPLPIQPDDPSEALRSSEIIPLLSKGFDIVARRDYGGTLLSVLYPAIDWAAAPPHLLSDLIRHETALLDRGTASFYTVIVARPKRGIRRLYARCWYSLAPKLRRIRWEILTRLTSRHVNY